MQDISVTFGKIVATPTPTAWSMAYNAGNLFAVVALESEEETLLNALGKDVIKTLEGEYFTIEEKTLASIKQAVVTAVEKIPQHIAVSFVVGAVIKDIVYVYVKGQGVVLIKRGKTLGTILSHTHAASDKVLSASGHIQDGDAIILETQSFAKLITHEQIKEALLEKLPSDAVEILAPKIHKTEHGAASAIILSLHVLETPSFETTFAALSQDEAEIEEPIHAAEEKTHTDQSFSDDGHEEEKTPEEEPLPEQPEAEDEKAGPIEQTPTHEEPVIIHHTIEPPTEDATAVIETDTNSHEPKKRPSLPNFFAFAPRLSHTRKLFLSIVLILLVVFGASLFFAKQHQQDSQRKAAFTPVFQQAQKKYQDGQALEELNQILASSDYHDAQTILEQNKDKFEEGTNERKQIDDLLAQINAKIGNTPGNSAASNQIKATPTSDENGMLTAEKANKDGLYFSADDKNIYFVTSSAINQLTSPADKPKELLKKDTIWHSPSGLGVYNGNLYLLDNKDNQIYKFVPSGNTYSNANYLSSSVDFSNATAMAIDSAIYVLFTNGTVDKYLRGAKQTFSLSGLTTPLKNPTRIFTNENTDHLYILDNGNSRVVALSKDGAFVAAYPSQVVAKATDFRVDESAKKIFLLSSGTIYSLPLK